MIAAVDPGRQRETVELPEVAEGAAKRLDTPFLFRIGIAPTRVNKKNCGTFAPSASAALSRMRRRSVGLVRDQVLK